MSTLGFEDYVEPLKLYLQKFREAEVTDLQCDCVKQAVLLEG
jgi:hypothetical protein